MVQIRAAHIHITGVVQGVGFRPFVFNLARQMGLSGWVRNTSAGVDIQVEGESEALSAFAARLEADTPPLARIDRVAVRDLPVNGFSSFEILHSQPILGAFQPISPDVSICPDCLRELFDPSDRRYRYPFINCTNCGPRFTIIEDIPYDRPKTTMAGFPLCPDCAAEYQDPADRRFHAQPVACPVCGPQIWLESSRGDPADLTLQGDDALRLAQQMLAEGKIIAIKGLGGFHLACDAANPGAVSELRRRKLRIDKPFALMAPNPAVVKMHCIVSDEEEALLVSRERPVVILRRRPTSSISREAAPQQDTLGFMLPYTPLHYLLFSNASQPIAEDPGVPKVLVMTSGNLSEEPIATENEEARRRLAALADAFLMHDRPIRTRCDDSVVRLYPGRKQSSSKNLPVPPSIYPLRRSRGYAPFPIKLPWDSPSILALGAELKNTFCITRSSQAFMSHHIGDLENFETLQSFEDGIQHFEKMFRIQPAVLAYDLHPNYLATRYALERCGRENLPAIGVQHHHAHIAACMAEHGLADEEAIIGVAFDGTGYGEDGAIWGGEFLLARYSRFQRAAHLKYVPLPGGDAAIRKPARIALAYLWQAGIDWDPSLSSAAAISPQERSVLRAQLEQGINTPLTSSMGRLFDAAASLAGVRHAVSYEAQAAIEFETLACMEEGQAYPFALSPVEAGLESPIRIDPAPLLQAVLDDLRRGVPLASISARFHNGVAGMVHQVCSILRSQTGISTVALSGGVWQNMTLLTRTHDRLQSDDFTVLIHQQVPCNDGGLALGQAAAAFHQHAS